jgi:CheY-like chemotaxis protein
MNHRTAGGAPQDGMAQASELPALEARIKFMDAELARVRAEFATFSSRISHDMQAIFRNIDGFGCALQTQAAGKLTDKEAHYLERMLAGARRGDSLMRDLAALSAAAVAQMRPCPVDLARLVEQCIRDLSPSLTGRAVEWETVAAPWPRVVADPALLRLAMDHLLANAVKFTRDRVPARIRIAMAATSREYVITVTDNGTGFDPEYVARLFNAFERLHLPTEFEGNGVGLAVVRTVAERHGGRAVAEVPPQGGASFTIALRQDADDGASPQDARNHGAAAGAAAVGKLRILVVDDEPMVLTTVRLMLERDGHEVVTAAGGAAGVKAIEQQAQDAKRFDLIVSDWLMPGIGGAEVVHAARAFQSRVRVIVLTGQRPGIGGAHDVTAAVDHVLGKPFTPAQLRSAVAAASGRPNGAA